MNYTGDGWAVGLDGSRRWGTMGAAGLFLTTCDAQGRTLVLMQHRAMWTNRGGTWALPGGACDVGETPEDTALRETWEETGVRGQDVEILASLVTSTMDLDHVLRRRPTEPGDEELLTQALGATDPRAELQARPITHPEHGGRAVFGLNARFWWEVPDHSATRWTYTTVIARAQHQLELNATAESQDLKWWPLEDLAQLDLMPEFAASLPELEEVLAAVTAGDPRQL
ncbi:NUDIX domain-containing protein [Corynebacterium heidelbergense]|uniref:NUDIX hydrolase n=1 Tax=Corynebacterium heidelbergense TaxID=2055947 RepID=A0A364VBF1_9CORY|nr:NUDIX domain-containing protein [Corynebacterium heidelbergense]RAV33944.1 NUDIX hydrolase [Corynebacterium heidelbergense]WCZ36864.1 RNA pyrophosphohydrolase [Corynebacterium heidelbergense]